jgi:glycosyltransferase involved in cell wall biosynthesis
MIVIYETHATGKTHVPFNAGLLRTAALAYPDQTIRFYAGRSHLDDVTAYMAEIMPPNVEFREINIPDRKLSYMAYGRAMWKSLKIIAGQTPDGTLLTLSFVIPESLVAAKLFMRASKHFCNAQAVLHGQLGEIAGWRTHNPILRLLDFKSALAHFNTPRLRYIVLEASIGQELTRLMPVLTPLIDVLPHPLPEDKTDYPAATVTPDAPLNIGYLGLITKQKGFHIFRDIAEAVKKRAGGKVGFLAIGHTQGRPLPENIDCLDIKPKTSYLDRAEFVKLINACHFICLPYASDTYRLVASGVLLDAMAYGKPIIAFKTPVTCSLFEEFGDVGNLCETPADMENAIIHLCENPDPVKYLGQCRNMAVAAATRKPGELAKTYRLITDGLFNPASKSAKVPPI